MSWDAWQADSRSALLTFYMEIRATSDLAATDYAQLWRNRLQAAFIEFGGGGSGDVTGPASSTDNALVRFDGTTGKLIQNSSATLSDAGALSVGSLTLGTALPVTSGGTGAANASDARTNLGLAIGVNVQAYSATLTTLASLTPTADYVIVGNGSVWTSAQLQHTQLSSASLAWTASGHTGPDGSLGGWAGGVPVTVPIGSSGGVQAWSANLDTIAGLAKTSGYYMRANGSAWTSSAIQAGDLPAGTLVYSGTAAAGNVTRHDGSAWQLVSDLRYLVTVACGTGVDGDLDFDGAATVTVRGNAMVPSGGVYTLACDLHARTLTLRNGVVLVGNGFVVRALTCTVPASATVIIRDGGGSSTGTSGAGAFSNTSTTDRVNGAGATGRNTAGIGASASSLSSTALGGAGGAGGTSTSAGGAGGSTTWTTANQNATGWPFDSLLSLRTFTAAVWKGGGGGGAGGCASGVSGGGGAGGGVMFVCVGHLELGASASLTVSAPGGSGGPATGTNAGGGGGGGGGYALLSRQSQTLGSGASVTVSAPGGSGGAGIGTGAAGASGSAGRTHDIGPVV